MKGHPWLVPLYRSLCKQHGRLGTVAEDLACLGVAPVQAVPPLGDEGASWQRECGVAGGRSALVQREPSWMSRTCCCCAGARRAIADASRFLFRQLALSRSPS